MDKFIWRATFFALDDEYSFDAGITTNITINIIINITTNETQKKILAMMDENPGITSKELFATIGISERNIKSSIKTLREAGLVGREGATKNGRWIVKW